MSDKQTIVVSPVDYKTRQIAAAKEEAAELHMDLAPEGGRYRVGEQWVDADGNPVKAPKDGAAVKTGDAG